MYHEFYGLRQAPFKITPDTRLFYPGGNRGEILDALVYAISSGEGIIKVVGEVGSGKTMLCRMLEVRLSKEVEIVYLPNPSLTPEDILHNIALEMGLKVDPAVNRIHVMQDLHQCLLQRHIENRRVVVFVEEAQAMPLETLEEIRLLSNLETQQDKLLQIVLFGQPELDKNLNVRSIRQLRERITHSFTLPPLNAEDVRQYVRFRLNAVGYRGPDMFDLSAYKAIASASRGLTRRVNILADKSLLAAFAENTHTVTRRHALKAITDSEMKRPRSVKKPLTALAAAGAVVAVGLGIWNSGWVTIAPPGSSETSTASVVAATEPSTGEAEAGVSVAQAEETTAKVDEVAAIGGDVARKPESDVHEPEPPSAGRSDLVAGSDRVVSTAQQTDARASSPEEIVPEREAQQPVTMATATSSDATSEVEQEIQAAITTVAQVQMPSKIAMPEEFETAVDEAVVAVSSATAREPLEPVESVLPNVGTVALSESTALDIAEVEQAKEAPAAQEPQATMPASNSIASAEPAAERVVDVDSAADLLDQRLSAARDWLSSADRSHFTIQLLATDVSQEKSLEDFLRRWSAFGSIEQIYIYRTKVKGGAWFGVLYEDFETYTEARAALEGLPSEFKRYKPFIRNVRDIENLG